MATVGEELVRRMAAGDGDAFARFYDRYSPLVYPLILRIARDRTDAAAVLQDVFWETWRSATTYDPARGTPEAWVVTRARTRAIDRLRSVRRRSETFVAPLDEAIAAAPSETGGDAADRASDRSVVTGALGRLPGPQREVLELAYYGGGAQTGVAGRIKQPLAPPRSRSGLGGGRGA